MRRQPLLKPRQRRLVRTTREEGEEEDGKPAPAAAAVVLALAVLVVESAGRAT